MRKRTTFAGYYKKRSTDMADRGLGMIPPTDDRHIRRYGLTAETMPTKPTAVVFGMNWHLGFNRSRLVEKNGRYRFPTRDKWGPVEGGHAICSKPPAIVDPVSWWRFHDQGQTPACTGFATARQGALHNRVRYDGAAIYHKAQEIDEWEGEDYEGSSVRAAMDVARTMGLPRVRAGMVSPFTMSDGISANRWARSIEEIAACLDPEHGGKLVLDAGEVPLLQSWGVYYPHFVFVDLEAINTLIFEEGGEATVVTDR